MGEREDWAEEHPHCDRVQNVMIILTLGVWGLDSFIASWTTFLSESVPFPVRLLVGLVLFVFGGYMTWSSHETIFGGDGSPVLVDRGVYGLCRHPMYLGYMIVEIGLLLDGPQWHNFLIFAAHWCLFVYRMSAEERVLRNNPDYVTYSERVRYRLIPGIY